MNRKKALLESTVRALWLKMCKHDGIDPKSLFVVFSTTNPHSASYNSAMGRLLELRKGQSK